MAGKLESGNDSSSVFDALRTDSALCIEYLRGSKAGIVNDRHL